MALSVAVFAVLALMSHAGAFFDALGKFSALFGVEPWDPVSFLAGVAILLTISIAASWLPARMASRVEPVTALHAV